MKYYFLKIGRDKYIYGFFKGAWHCTINKQFAKIWNSHAANHLISIFKKYYGIAVYKEEYQNTPKNNN